MHPITLALLGVLAYRTYQGKGRLAEMLGHAAPSGGPPREGGGLGSGGPQGGGLAGLLGGLGGAAAPLSSGLSDLFKDFQEKGLGDTIKSWVEKGPNKPMSSADLEQALGSDKIAWLMKETGLSREDLLAGLSRELPEAVDKLTPDGRLPSEQETAAISQTLRQGQADIAAASEPRASKAAI